MKNRSDLFKINFIYFVLMCLFVIIRIVFSLDFVQDSWVGSYLGSLIIQIGIMFLIPFALYCWLFKKKPKQTFSDFKFTKINFKAVLISIGIGICAYFLSLCISIIFNLILSFFGYSASSSQVVTTGTWGDFLISIVLTAILPGFCEEFAHRGLLVKGFSVLGERKTIIYVGLLFGLMHLNVSQFFYAAIIGGILVVLTIASGSIIPAMIVHFMNNFISVYLSYAKDLNLPLKNMNEWLTSILFGHGAISVLLFITLMVGSLILILVLVKQLFKETYGKKFDKIKSDIAKEYLRDEIMGQIESPEVTSEDAGLIYDEVVNVEGKQRIIKLKIPFWRMGVEVKPKYKATFLDNIFFYASIVLGVLVTLFTLIWGIM